MLMLVLKLSGWTASTELHDSASSIFPRLTRSSCCQRHGYRHVSQMKTATAPLLMCQA